MATDPRDVDVLRPRSLCARLPLIH
eukprot:COSAG02_NODE_24275_length_693_cov_0.868687_1_plen_24_part_10